MADQDQINSAEREARLALLESIKQEASGGNSQQHERLAYAYAPTVGAAYGKLPGGPTHIDNKS